MVFSVAFGLHAQSSSVLFVFTNNLSMGNSGGDVIELQTYLIANGYDIPAISSGVVPKGYFGAQTKLAVQKYQTSQGLPSTGFVGPLTRGKLNAGSNAKAINVLTPNGGEIWTIGTKQNITWREPSRNIPGGCTNPGISCATISPAPVAVNVLLVPYRECENHPNGCPAPLPSEGVGVGYYIIAENYLGPSLTWTTGNVIGIQPSLDRSNEWQVSPGKYRIRVCEGGMYPAKCDGSDAPFTITSSSGGNLPPVINSIEAPTTLKVGEVGTWKVSASDPENGQLSYTVDWGDQGYGCNGIGPCAVPTLAQGSFVQNSTFTHSYGYAQTVTVKFTVRDVAGNVTQTSTTVVVTELNAPTVSVVSPNGGERWTASSTKTIKWSTTNTNSNQRFDLYLSRFGPPPPCVYSIPACMISIPFEAPIVLDRNISGKIYYWIVATDIVNNDIPVGNYYAKVCLAGTSTCDYSDNSFEIIAPN